MDHKDILVEFYGEYDVHTQLLIGVWVLFPGSWRMPSLWRDVGGLIQAVRDNLKSGAEFVPEELALLEPRQSIVCGGLGHHDALNVLGSPLEWQL